MVAYVLNCRWDGEAFRPLGRFLADCKEHRVTGHIYRLADIEERSDITHNHQFAWLGEAWKQLPEELMDIYPSPAHLRKRALIDAGFYDETIIDAGSNPAALRVAAEFRRRNDFSLVIVRGPIVVIRDPKSQNRRTMDAKTFRASKNAILEIIAEKIGVTPEQLTRETGRSA